MTTVSQRLRMCATIAAICVPAMFAFPQSRIASAAAPAPGSLGMRPSGGFLKQDRLDQYERELGQPIDWYVGMAGRQSAADMRGSVYGQMEARDAVLPNVAHRMDVVMTVPLAFGKGSARDDSGRTAIRAKLLETASGRWDADYRKVASSLVAGGYPDAVIRLGHEFTGAWYPWSSQGNDDAYISAFRHIHEVLRSVAPHLRFDWNPARNTFGEFGPSAYPGDAYVDVISMDVYYEPWKGDPAPLTDEVWKRRYEAPLQAHRDFAIRHGKPVAYPEWANGDVDQPKFIEEMHQWFTKLPAAGGGRLLYHSYFNVNQTTYDLDHYPKSKARYLALFGRTGASPIAPATPVITVPVTTPAPAPAPAPAPVNPVAPAPAAAPAASDTQFTFFDQRAIHRADEYATLSATSPANWTNPENFVDGAVYMRLDIVDKPSDLPVQVLVCMWRDRYTQERCTGAGVFETEGRWWVRLRNPDAWYNKAKWDWDRPIDNVRILVKDAATGTLLTQSKCGTACYKGSENLADHTPITFDAAMVIVAPGAELNPLASWSDCPVGFAPACTNAVGKVSGIPTISLPTTMTATAGEPLTIPAVIGADTISWTRVSGPTVQWSNRKLARPMVTFGQPGTSVLRVTAKRDGHSTRADVTVTVGAAGSPPATTPPTTTTPANPVPATTTPPTTTTPATTTPATTTPATTSGPKLSLPAIMTATVDRPLTIPAEIEASSISWWRVSGPSMSWSARNVEQPAVTFRKVGTYVLRVSARRNGETVNADITVTVGTAPTAPAEPPATTTVPVTPGTTAPTTSQAPAIVSVPATLHATIGTPIAIPARIGAPSVSVSWRRMSGAAMTWSSRDVVQPTVTFRTAGTYVLRLTARYDGTPTHHDVEVTVTA